MPALIFTLESDPSAFIALREHADLPAQDPGLKLAKRTRRQVTDYGGRNARSIQITAQTYEPIELSGRWRDQQSGQPGRARALYQSFMGLAARAELVRLEWGQVQLWGMLDFDATFKLEDEIAWTITFHPDFDAAPAFLRPPAYKTQIRTYTSNLDAKVEALAARSTPPLSAPVLPSFAAAVLADYLAAAAAVNGVLIALGEVLDYADLSVEVAKSAQRQAFSAVVALKALTGRLRAATLATAAAVSSDPSEAARATVMRWIDDFELEARSTQAAAAATLRALVNSSEPPASRVHVVRSGETLQTIAILYFGDLSAWEDIADANALSAVDVAPGTQIVIPDEVSRV